MHQNVQLAVIANSFCTVSEKPILMHEWRHPELACLKGDYIFIVQSLNTYLSVKLSKFNLQHHHWKIYFCSMIKKYVWFKTWTVTTCQEWTILSWINQLSHLTDGSIIIEKEWMLLQWGKSYFKSKGYFDYLSIKDLQQSFLLFSYIIVTAIPYA